MKFYNLTNFLRILIQYSIVCIVGILQELNKLKNSEKNRVMFSTLAFSVYFGVFKENSLVIKWNFIY